MFIKRLFDTPLKTKYLISLLVILSALPVWGQFYKTSRYADDNGLPSRIIRDVVQDSLGYIWVAGNNGLYKFDGQKFHGYYASLQDTTGLRDNKINTLIAAKDSRIWVATPKGLHVLENDRITYVELLKSPTDAQNYAIALFEDSRGNVWVGTYDGLFIIEKETGVIREQLLQDEELSKEVAIWNISEDREGRIWVCRSRKNPLLIDPDTYAVKEVLFEAEGLVEALAINPFKYIHFNEDMILVSSGSGLWKGTLMNDSILRLEKFLDEKGNVLEDRFLYNTIVDHEGAIWTATWKNYFQKFHYKDGYLEEQEVISKNGLMGMTAFARSIYEDSHGNIWIPNSNGLYKLSKDIGKLFAFPPSHIGNCLPNISIYGMAEDGGGHLWINTPTDLLRINKQDILNNKCPTDYLHYKNEHFALAREVFVDSKNRLWISGQEGLSIAQLDENYVPGTFSHFTAENGLPHKWSNEVYEVDENTFWLSNYIRLVKITFPDGDFRNPEFRNYNSSTERDDALVNSYTLNLEKDSRGNLWVGTFSGVSKLISDENEGVFKNYTSGFGESDKLSNNAIKRIFNDSKGRLWIGTQTGLNLYDAETDTFKQFGRKDGLPSEYILGIAEDSQGHLWITTTQGVFKAIYNESMQGFVHIEYFSTREGLADNISNRNAIYIDPDDNVFIGSAQGISVFGHTESMPDARDFNVTITTLESTQRNEQGFHSIKHMLEDGKITLNHKENSIQLAYAVLDFTAPSYNSYRHKFLPVSEDWIETGSDAQLNYYNLSPGEYQLVLDGSNNQGVWSKEPLVLSISITPPFWKTKWAYALYALLLLGGGWLLYRLRIRKKVQELEQETRLERALIREREQLRNENAADFHDELGSKVTKISMFLTLAERTLQENKDPSNWFGKMRENIKDLSGSFRDLLWVIDPKKDSLSDAILRLKDFGEDLFSNSNTHYTTHGYSEGLQQIQLDPQTKKQVVLIFKEAMHNCAKYSECTVVELTVETIEGYSSIRLKDNGKGFNVHRQSKGRGLTNMKNRSEKIGGNLSIVSGEEGTVVVLHRIPHLRDRKESK